MSGLPAKRKYYLNEQLAYTEDHVLVKNLFLFNVAEELGQHQLQKYFERFGRVLRIQLYVGGEANSRIHKKTKWGYVAFADPLHAAKVLQRKVHYVNGRRLFLQPSDSWHQPDAQVLSGNQGNVESDESPVAIMNLNDHCLEHILCQLSLQDRIHFARTCTRFRSIYQGMSTKLDKSINFDVFETMTVWDVRDFFQLSGHHVKEIEGTIPNRHCKRLGEFLGKHCTNLQSMRIIANKLTPGNISKLFANLNSLENLTLRGCGLSNESLRALNHLRQLKKLDISHNDKLTGVSMYRLPDSIESLTLTNCNGLKPKLLTTLFLRLSKLKELHTKGIFLYPCIQKLVNEKCCESLEVLSLSCGDSGATEYKHIARLPSLKKLILHIHQDAQLLPPMLTTWLVEHKSKQLEHFEIRTPNCINAEMIVEIGKLNSLRKLCLPNNDGINDRGLEALNTLQYLEEINIKNSANATDNGVLRLILACPNLQVLHLEDCVQLSDKLLFDIILRLRKNQSQRPLPIKLHMFGSKVDQFTLLNADVAAKNIIDVSYTASSPTDLNFVEIHDDLYNLDEDYDSFGSEMSFDSEFVVSEEFLSDDDFVDFHDIAYLN